MSYDGRHGEIYGYNPPVMPGETYTIKLVIADATDNILDSGVFIEAGSFNSEAILAMTLPSQRELLVVAVQSKYWIQEFLQQPHTGFLMEKLIIGETAPY